MSIKTQIFLTRQTMIARHRPHEAMMTLLAKGVSFEQAARFIASARA